MSNGAPQWSPSVRKAALVGLALVLAALAVMAWQRWFSTDAEVERVYRACLAEIEAGNAKIKAEIERGSSGTRPEDPGASIIKGLTDGMGRMLDGVSGRMGDAVCGAVRDACRDDFDGRICSAARERYP